MPASMIMRAGRLEAVGDRQQQRHRHGRTDAGQHTDGGADEDADQGEQQVHRRRRGGEAFEQEAEVLHRRAPLQDSLEDAGRQADPQTDGEAVEGDQGQRDRDHQGADVVTAAERERASRRTAARRRSPSRGGRSARCWPRRRRSAAARS